MWEVFVTGFDIFLRFPERILYTFFVELGK